MFKKNTFVAKPDRPEWGIGIVTSDQRDQFIPVFFENRSKIIKFKESLANLVTVDEPGKSRLFLENALIDDHDKNDIPDRRPFPEKLERFVERFPGGLRGDLLEQFERKYKLDAHKVFKKLLDKDIFEQLIKDEAWSELADRIKRTHSLNLLSKFELIRFTDVLKQQGAQKDISHALFNLLHGDGLLEKRFVNYAKVLSDYDCDKWTIITLPLFLFYPDKYMFVKPTMTQEAAENRGFNIQYDSNLNWNTYQQVLLFAQDLFERLSNDNNPQVHPIDMIDVQTFMWCTFASGWSDDDIKKAETQLN